MKHKKIWLGILILIVFLIMAACGSAEISATPTLTATPSPPPATPATPTLTAPPLHPNATPNPMVTATPTLGIGSTQVSPKDGMVLVYVPAGEFLMGSEKGHDAEKPQHTVFLDAYWIDQTEVTYAMYAKCVADGACEPSYGTEPKARSNYYVVVTNVDWNQANTYCQWAGGRLPTEAEWEKAARGTDGRTYPWGEGIDCNKANYYGKNGDNDYCIGDTTTVGRYPQGASVYGALDMAGNVLEWVADWFSETYYIGAPSENPQGPASGEVRVLRGGSYRDESEFVRASNRMGDDPDLWDYVLGFRCAR